LKIKIGIPVVCQNGHRAVYYFKLENLEFKDEGVSKESNCKCPKFELGEGWKQDPNRRVIYVDRDISIEIIENLRELKPDLIKSMKS
jgi:hypothetical protein